MRTKRALRDLTSEKFGRLTVLYRAEIRGKNADYVCECECGNFVTVRGQSLVNGDTRSCKCLARELTGIRALRHGCAAWGDRKASAEYRAWLRARTKYEGVNADFPTWYRATGPKPDSQSRLQRKADGTFQWN
jgi:hypothetical protein